MTEPQPPPSDKVTGWLTAVKGLTLTNALVIVILAIVAVPAYLAYRAVNDAALLDRFMSHYHEIASQNVACTIREARSRGGPEMWFISSGFAFQGADRWAISVILNHQPNDTEVMSYCESLKLIADRMLERGRGGNDDDKR